MWMSEASAGGVPALLPCSGLCSARRRFVFATGSGQMDDTRGFLMNGLWRSGVAAVHWLVCDSGLEDAQLIDPS